MLVLKSVFGWYVEQNQIMKEPDWFFSPFLTIILDFFSDWCIFKIKSRQVGRTI